MRTLGVARQAARRAGEVISRYYRDGVEIREKSEGNLVSAADVEAEQAIAEVIRDAFPGHAILGEECHSDPAESEHLWLVDPLDGTTNFAHGIPHFATSIAYYERGVPLCAVIHNPIRGDWFTAVRGEGAIANGRPARVNAHAGVEQTLVASGFFYDRGPLMESTFEVMQEFCRAGAHGIRRFGSAALDLCGVGCGYYGIYFEFQLHPWDFAAGRLFVEEAGGQVTTTTGAPLPIALSSVLATNGALHATATGLTRRYG
ncbi:MAG: inositol monophosphatase [Planctomyces sp.]|nr:inositol monophosphatase [Planctomyces sp.]